MARPKYFALVITLLLAFCLGCNNGNIQSTSSSNQPIITPFRLSSPAFKNGDNIPMLYTCDSTNISPALHWNNPFNNTASFALVVEDPDASLGTWIHWIVYNIPATDTILPAQLPRDSVLPNKIKQGFTSFGRIGYGGPCPPEGTHHYHFMLYALNAKLNLPAGLSKSQLLTALKGHILAETELIGKYTRTKK